VKVMLLAAGKGTRMFPLTAHTPKPLLKVGGLSLIEHQILKLRANGFTEFVINHAWLGKQIETALGDGSRYDVSIQWSREAEPLETAGGILQALSLLGTEPFMIVNADIWTNYPFASLRHKLNSGDLAHLVLVPNPEHHPNGDFALDSQQYLQLPDLSGLSELQLQSASQPSAAQLKTYTYSGIAVYSPVLFAGVTDKIYPLLPLLKRAIAEHRASGECFAGEWLDVGTPERLEWLDNKIRGEHE
jgi:N-acetyl-alpha-D-muramate 1-phosphate uridylyltransferase